MTDEEKIRLVDGAIARASYEAGAHNERKRIVAILERDPKLRFIAALIDSSTDIFKTP